MTVPMRCVTLIALLAVAACSGMSRSASGSGGPLADPYAGGPARWQRQSVPSTSSCRSVSAVSALIAWAGCSAGRVFRTVDGGVTWTAYTVSGAARLDFRGIKAFDANTAVIASAGPAELGQAHIYPRSTAESSGRSRGVTRPREFFWMGSRSGMPGMDSRSAIRSAVGS